KLQAHSNELSNLTDRPSKLDLVSRFDPDHMLSSTKTIEHKVVGGNYVRGGQHLVFPGWGGVALKVDVITKGGRPSASSVHAVLGHASCDDEVRNPCFRKFLLQVCSEERVRFSLSDNLLTI